MIISKKHRLIYWPIPKNACTSFKWAFYKLEHGHTNFPKHGDGIHAQFRAYPNGGKWPFFTAWRCFSFIVVRDPIERFVSAYRNRVLHHRALSQTSLDPNLQQACIDDINFFIENFEAVSESSREVLHHFRPQTDFVANVVGRVDRVVEISNVPNLVAEIQARCPEFEVPRKQVSEGLFKEHKFELTDKSLEKLNMLYRQDYEMLGPYLKKSL